MTRTAGASAMRSGVGVGAAPGGGGAHQVRRTLPSAVGEPMVWLTGGALVLCLVMIGALAAMVVVSGSKTFWPAPIERLTLSDGSVVMGVRVESDEGTAETGARALYRVGNRDIGNEPFRWINESSIVERETPTDAVMLEREAWGVWFGVPESIVRVEDDGSRTVVAQGAEATLDAYGEMHGEARARRARANRLRDEELGAINKKIEAERLRVEEARLAHARADEAPARMGMGVWIGVLVLTLGCAGIWVRVRDLGSGIGARYARLGRTLRFSLASVVLGGAVALVIGAPWMARTVSSEDLARIEARAAEREAALGAAYNGVIERIRAIEAEDARTRMLVVEPTQGRFAPVAQTEPDEPMVLSQVVRLVQANDLSLGGKVGVYLSRWWEFLSTAPREANTEGGVFPVIVGTVLLTLLLTIVVTPLGVIAALYLREYAKQGLLTSVIRIAVNNLAGVPSIVYGVFGLGFFCYTIGRYVDTGPAEGAALSVGAWWGVFALAVVSAIGAHSAGLWGTPIPGKRSTLGHKVLSRGGWCLWGLCVVLVVVAVTRTPYFHGLFAARAAEGSPTFGARGLLWASLTLALLTLPVVIVATEEALSAVPNSMREGSYGCGASKWQTLRRVVLPGALPGILTGAILAMARGAGEVAPLMLVGAVKLNQDLPVSGTAPFLHADRSFMHLGFHIYDLGFQSPDSQAARPLVWTTTLLFLSIVLALNLAAIVIRARLRGRMTGSAI